MCMQLVVCAKQQKPVVRLPGPVLRSAARVVRSCLFRQSSISFLQDKIASRSTLCLTSYKLCIQGRTVITHLRTPPSASNDYPVTKPCRLHGYGVRLRHATVGPIFA